MFVMNTRSQFGQVLRCLVAFLSNLFIFCFVFYIYYYYYLVTSDLVHILEGKTQGLVSGASWGIDVVQSVKQGLAGVFLLVLALLHFPLLEPGHVGGALQHVVSMPTRDGHERHHVRVVSDLLDVGRHFLLDLVEPSLQVKQSRETCTKSLLRFRLLFPCW